MENMGITELGAAVEWSTAGDDGVCKLCAPLNGIVLTTEEARGLIPRHDGCRCCWTPANVGEKDGGQKRTRKAINKAIDQSVKAEVRGMSTCTTAEQRPSGNWRGATVAIAENRPRKSY